MLNGERAWHVVGGARFLPLTVRCSIPSEELTSTILTGVAIRVPENQGATCCLPRKLAILEDLNEVRKSAQKAVLVQKPALL